MSVVAQDTVLFNDTIENNIAMGRRGATHEEIVAAAKIANAHDFIMRVSDGLRHQHRRPGRQTLGRSAPALCASPAPYSRIPTS